MSILRVVVVLLELSLLSLLCRGATLNGKVEVGGGNALSGASVRLYAGRGSAVELDSTVSDASGTFTLNQCEISDAIYYVIAEKGTTKLAAVVGSNQKLLSSNVVVNERTTVGFAFSLNQFINGESVSGGTPGINNAAYMSLSIVDGATGSLGDMLTNSANSAADTLGAQTLNSLANFLTVCTAQGQCSQVFDLTSSSNTLDAIHSIAQNPVKNPSAIFVESSKSSSFSPALTTAPTSWIISFLILGNGMGAPGRMAFADDGTVWVTNNIDPNVGGASPFISVFDPRGVPLSFSPLNSPGGVSGTGYGIAIRPSNGDIYIGNYGGNSITQLDRNGNPYPNNPYTDGNTCKVQGMSFDKKDNFWFVNNGGSGNPFASPCNPNLPQNQSITVYVGGDHTRAVNFFMEIDAPFDVQIDAEDRAWVSNAGSNTIVVVRYNEATNSIEPAIGNGFLDQDNVNNVGQTIPGFPPALSSPKTVAVDSLGNVWVANFLALSVSVYNKDGELYPISPIIHLAMAGPWGLAIDGDDNVWVAASFGAGLFHLCGFGGNCPAGVSPGDQLNPIGGFVAPFQLLTAVQIDEAGNLWTCNNVNVSGTLNTAGPGIVGGDGMVVVVGGAKPVATPLLAEPQAPAPGNPISNNELCNNGNAPVSPVSVSPLSPVSVSPVSPSSPNPSPSPSPSVSSSSSSSAANSLRFSLFDTFVCVTLVAMFVL